jgi:hypothetical protein
MSVNVKCRWCSKVVPRHGKMTRDFNLSTLTWGQWYPNPQAGEPNVSISMGAIDPLGLFCTMRCAARCAVYRISGGK